MFERILKIFRHPFASRVLFVLTLAAVAGYLYRGIDWAALSGLRPDYYWLGLALAFHAGFELYYACLWFLVTLIAGIPLSPFRTLAVCLYSNFGKYLPLKVAGMGYRVAAYGPGRSGRALQVCYIEAVACLIGGGLVALVMLFFLRDRGAVLSPEKVYLLLGATVFCVLFFLPSIQKRVFDLGLRLLGADTKGFSMSSRQTFLFVILYSSGWLLAGSALYCVLRALGCPLGRTEWIAVNFYYAAAAIVGNVSVFAPAGLGVREGILMFGLSSIVSPTHAALAAVLARLVATAVEGTGILAGFFYLEAFSRPRAEDSGASRRN